MSKVYTDDNFMYHNCPDANIASWQNQLIDEYDLDYAPGNRPYIGATDEQVSAAYRIADKKRRETVLDNLFSRKEKPQERICIDDATPEQWDAIDRATEKYRAESDSVDWSIAPSWANYWAMDSDGEAYWYERVPEIDVPDGVWTPAIKVSESDFDLTESVCLGAYNFGYKKENWQSSLNKRDRFACQEAALDAMVKDAEELDLYDDEIVYNLNAEAEKEKARDKMIGGDHYRQGGIQPIEYIHANKLSFCEGNVIKYISRWRYKDGVKDLEKAKHYIELLMELEDDY